MTIIIELQKKYTELKQILDNNNQFKYTDNDFKDLNQISKGGYGKIYSAYSIKDKIDICLKKIDINYMEHLYKNNNYPDNNYLKDINNEIEILKLLSPNKNSVKYYGNYDIIKEKIIIMEKCDDNLNNLLKKRKKAFSIDEIKKMFKDLNEFFNIIYKNKIIHRDLKLSNFLVKYINKEKTEFIVKLADYGIGKYLSGKNTTFSGIKGSLETLAPEIILQKTKKYDSIGDIFSLGIILYQLSHFNHPFGENENGMIDIYF